MSIRNSIRSVIGALPGNKLILANSLKICNDGDNPISREQIAKAMRDLALAQGCPLERVGPGLYRVKGRRVK